MTRPAPGVYTYDTEGEETVSFGGARHQYPAETYAALRHSEGCGWEVEHRLIEEHVDHHRRCTTHDRVLALADGQTISFYGQTSGGHPVCDPPLILVARDDQPGATRQGTCRSEEGDETRTRLTVVGSEPLVIDGVPTDAVRLQMDSTLHGRSTGTATTTTWLHPATGLILQQRRHVDTDASTFFGGVRYTETASIKLRSLHPAR